MNKTNISKKILDFTKEINSSSKKKFVILAMLIFIVAISLRIYKFEENLLFEIDQARDWKLAKISLENGWQSLPLLGPRAGGTEFRLGPITNYFQFFSLKIFGDSPAKTSYPDLIFSLASIPLLLLLLRKYFRRSTTLLMIAAYSFSLFVLEYSRFGWNPNPVPFFMILLVYSLINLSSSTDSRYRYFSVSGVAASIGVLIQLHTIMIAVVPIFVLLYFLLMRTKVNFRELCLAIAVFGFVSFPLILNESITNFGNSKAFFTELKSRGEGSSEFTFEKKVVKGFYGLSKAYYVILTSRNDIPELNRVNSSDNLLELYRFNGDKKIYFAVSLMILVGIFYSLYVMLGIFRKEKSQKRKAFAAAILILQLVYIPLLVFLAEKQDSRHYLGLVFVPFIFFGLYFDLIAEKMKGRLVWITYAFAVLIVALNLTQSLKWLSMVDSYDQKGIKSVNEEFILEPYFNVTLGQYENVTKLLEDQYKQDGLSVRLIGDVYHRRSIAHILNYDLNVPASPSGPFRDHSMHYYLLDETSDFLKKKEKLPQDILRDFDVEYKKVFGTITIFSLRIKDETVEIKEPSYISETKIFDFDPADLEDDPLRKLYLKDVFN